MPKNPGKTRKYLGFPAGIFGYYTRTGRWRSSCGSLPGLPYCCSAGLTLATVVGEPHCCSVVTVNTSNTVQLLTFDPTHFNAPSSLLEPLCALTDHPGADPVPASQAASASAFRFGASGGVEKTTTRRLLYGERSPFAGSGGAHPALPRLGQSGRGPRHTRHQTREPKLDSRRPASAPPGPHCRGRRLEERRSRMPRLAPPDSRGGGPEAGTRTHTRQHAPPDRPPSPRTPPCASTLAPPPLPSAPSPPCRTEVSPPPREAVGEASPSRRRPLPRAGGLSRRPPRACQAPRPARARLTSGS